ncbi:MAG TPA: hypothetical protein GX528_01645 [Firmicutes bacterium]|nr:hypothetical protein [Bacillota bacterium]
MGRQLKIVVFFMVLLLAAANADAAGKKGTLELVGVPEDASPGRYHTESGLFFVDVTSFTDAWIKILFEDMEITGKKLEWHTKDNYFIFTEGARLEKDDFKLTSSVLEYFGEEEKLIAQGDVEVVTEDATVRSQHLVYEEETDEALFTVAVAVTFEEGTLKGEKFLMDRDANELVFFGVFQGEFETDSK